MKYLHMWQTLEYLGQTPDPSGWSRHLPGWPTPSMVWWRGGGEEGYGLMKGEGVVLGLVAVCEVCPRCHVVFMCPHYALLLCPHHQVVFPSCLLFVIMHRCSLYVQSSFWGDGSHFGGCLGYLGSHGCHWDWASHCIVFLSFVVVVVCVLLLCSCMWLLTESSVQFSIFALLFITHVMVSFHGIPWSPYGIVHGL